VRALIGQSIQAKGSEGGLLVLYFMKDGSLKQMDEDVISAGRWAFQNNALCIRFPEDEEEEDGTCYTVTVDGTAATLTEPDQTGRRYKIVPGNPFKL
jgi:hypothetical protein